MILQLKFYCRDTFSLFAEEKKIQMLSTSFRDITFAKQTTKVSDYRMFSFGNETSEKQQEF